MTAQSEQTVTNITAYEGTTYQIGAEWVTFKVTGAETGGNYLVVEVTTPAGGGPPIHTHPAAEVFYVVEGQFEFPTLRDGKVQAVTASAGESVHVPSGVPHTYKNVGDAHGRLIGVLMPAPEMEGFFQEAGVVVTDRTTLPTLDDPMDMEKLIAASMKYHMEFFKPEGV